MNLPRSFSEVKLTIQNFNGWQRIWLVISSLIFIFFFVIWASDINNPFIGFENTNSAKKQLVSAEQLWNENEVDCKLNEKYASADFSVAQEKLNEIDAKLKKLKNENASLREGYYSYWSENAKKIKSNDLLISSLEESKKILFTSPVLAKSSKCNNLQESMLSKKAIYHSRKSIQFDPVLAFFKTTILFLLIFLGVIGVLYLLGFSLGWIYKGFKK